MLPITSQTTGKELDKNKMQFLNLGPKFIPTYNRQREILQGEGQVKDK